MRLSVRVDNVRGSVRSCVGDGNMCVHALSSRDIRRSKLIEKQEWQYTYIKAKL